MRLPKPALYLLYLLIFVGGLFGGSRLASWFDDPPAQADPELIGKNGADFRLPDLHRQFHQRSDWRGRILVLNFWASWCAPCREETPQFIELQNQYRAAGVQFVGIAIDEVDKVQTFVDEYGVNYPILVGRDDAMQVARDYGNRLLGLPYSVVLDPAGRIVWYRLGQTTRAEIEPVLQDQIRKSDGKLSNLPEKAANSA